MQHPIKQIFLACGWLALAGALRAADAAAPVAAAPAAPAPAAVAPALAPAAAPAVAAAPATNAPAAPAAARPAEGIRFQFDGLPYTEVLTRFAQMVNKPLISDTKIEGNLTFSDPRSYTYPEALETLNTILSLKGVMLVESDHYLRLVPFKELPQMPLRIFHGLEHTGDATPGEVVTVVLPLQNLEASEMAQPASAMLSSAGSIAPLSRGRGLIVTDRLSNIKRIRDLISAVDTASPVDRKMKSYTLRHASGAVLSDLINRTFGSASAPRRVEFNQATKQYQQLPPDPNDYITAVYDDASRVLVMFGPGDRMALSEALIKEFEEKNGAPGDVRAFYPQSVAATDLARMIRQAMPGVAEEAEPKATAATKAHVVVDAASNRLIVSAPTAGQMGEIERLIQTLDSGAAGTNASTNALPNAPQVRLFRCHVIDPDSLVKILTDAMTRPGYHPANERPFRVSLDSSTRSLVLTGTAEEVDQALSIARQLDSAPLVKRELKLIPLKASHASDFVTRIKPIYLDQARNFHGPAVPEPLMVPDDYNNRLLVSGDAEELKLMQDLIDQLDIAPDDAERQVKTIALKYSSANWLSTILQQMFGRQFSTDNPRRRIFLTPSTDDRTLVLQAPRALFPRIEETITALDVEPARGLFEVRTYQLTGANATDLVATLSRLFADRQDWQKRPAGVAVSQPRFEADAASNCLIVVATHEQLEQIESLVKELRASVEVATEVRVFRLKYCDPMQMVTLLDTLMHEQAPVLQGRFRSSPYGVPVADYGKWRIAAAPVLDAVVIQGTPEKIKQAEEIILSLDVEKADPVASIKAVPLKYASAAWLSTIITQLYGRQFQTDNPRSRVALTPSTDDRTLVIQAPPALLTRLAETVATLDVEPARGLFEVRTYQLTGANATDLVATLSRLFADRQDWQKRPVGVPVSQPRFEADAASNCLIVVATHEQLEQIDLLVKELRASVEVATEVRVFRLKFCDPMQMVTLLDTLMHEQAPVLQGRFRASPYGVPVADYGKWRIAAAPVLDAVVIQGTPEKIKQAEEIITSLDVEKADPVASIRAVPLKYASANWLSTIITQLYGRQFQTDNPRSRVALTPSTDDRTLVIQAPPALLARLAETVATLDVEPSRGVFEVRTYQLTGANATDLVATLSRLFADRQDWQKRPAGVPVTQPRFEADPASNCLIVAATREQLEQIDQLVKELRASVEVATEFRVFRLKYCDPDQMVTLLDTMLHEQAPAIVNRPRAALAGATPAGPVADYGKLRIAAAPVLDAVIIQGPPDKLRLAGELITSLDREKTESSSSIRTVHLVKARAEAVAEAVGKTLETRGARNSTRRTVITPVLNSNSILLDGPPAEVEEMLKIIHELDEESTDGKLEFRIYRLENGNAKELSRILSQMVETLARSDSRFGRTNQQAPVTIAIDDRSNSLIISGSAASFKVVERLLLGLDQAPHHLDRAMNLYTLVNADPFELATKLQSLYADRPKEEQITADADYFSSSITVVARPQDFAQIEEQIRRLDAAALDLSIQVRMVAIDKMPAAQMAAMLTNIYSQMTAGDVRIVELLPPRTPDTNGIQVTPIFRPRSNSVPPSASSPTNAQPGIAATNPSPAAVAGATNSARPIFPEVVVAIDKTANALLLSGPARELDRIQTIIRDLTRAAANNNTEMRIFPLTEADPIVVARMLDQLFRGDVSILQGQQGANAPRRRNGQGQGGPNGAVRVIAVAEPRSRSVIVRAQPNDFTLVESLIKQLDQAGANAQVGFRLVSLENSQADKLLPLVTQMLAELRLARPGEPVMVTRDLRGNALFAVGRSNILDQVESMIQKLDTPGSFADAEVAVVPLKNGKASQLATVLEGMLRPAAPGEATLEARELQEQVRRLKIRNPQGEVITLDLAKPIKIMADPAQGLQGGGNRLILISTPDNLRALVSVVGMMDTVPSLGTVRLFPLQYADAASMQRLLTDLYQGPGAARLPPEDRPNVSIDPRTDTLIVSGNEGAIAVVTNLIAQLDREGDAFTGQMRLVALKHARASQIAVVLEQFFRAKQAAEVARGPGARSIPSSVTPDDRSNTLLITGSRENFAAIEKMIDQLDSSPSAARTGFKTIPLRHATAAKVQTTLNQLFLRRSPTIRGEAPEPITIVEDSWANVLVVGATPEDMAMVESLVAQLDSEASESGLEVQVFALNKADARQIALTITTLYRTGGPGTPSVVTANVDERLNAVIVSAGQADLKRIGDLVKKLDTDQVTQVHQVRIFTLTNARALQLAAILSSVLNTKPTPLTDQSPGRQALLEFITRSPDGRELMTSALKEGIIIAPDPRANSLVISAPVEYMKFLERLIADLDALSPQVATIKVFPLKNADARQMMTVLTALFHLQALPQATSNPRTIQYHLVPPTQKDLAANPAAGPALESTAPATPAAPAGEGGVVGSAEETSLTVTVDLRSNSLLVGGTERYVALAGEIINTLDQSPAQERKAEVYRLKNARAVDIQNALQNFLRQDAQLIIAAVGQQAVAQEILDREATIVAETNSNTLLISATPRFFTELKDLVGQLDQPQRQVLIQVLLAEVTLTKDDELGVEWTYQTTGTTSSKTGTDFGLANALKTAGGFGSAVSGDSFNFLFRALQTEDRLHVLSRPQILTADNQLATIKVGQKVPLVTSSQTIALTGNPVNSINYQDVGVTLTVTPRISPDGFVKMDVSPEITQLSTATVTINTGVQAPIISQRLATTSVSVQSGQSIMVGGLMSTSDEFTTKRFPVLGSIPWLGNLFRSNIRNTTRTELLIVLTPQVLINGSVPATTNTTLNVTRDQLDSATFRDDVLRGAIERQILVPLYPALITNPPPAAVTAPAKTNAVVPIVITVPAKTNALTVPIVITPSKTNAVALPK